MLKRPEGHGGHLTLGTLGYALEFDRGWKTNTEPEGKGKPS